MNMTIILTAIAGYLLVIAKEIPKSMIGLFVANHGYSFSVISRNTELYNIISEWLLSLHKKSLDNNINGRQEWSCGGDKTYFSINYGNYMVTLGWFTIMFVNKKLIENNYSAHDKLDILIIGKNRDKYKNIISDLINRDKDKNMITIFPSREMYYNYLVPKKSFNDIFNSNKQLIINFLDKWKNQKQIFEGHGITYKTGIMLYGEAGTGKTTICRAIASYLDFNLHVINLKSYEKQEDLINRVIKIPQKSIILFEDIDCVVGNREDKESNSTEILDTLLNIIDGVSSPNNVVFMATTNHIEKLDSALIREGRFDLKVNVSKIEKDLAIEMCNHYKVSEEILNNEQFPINPSYLQQKIFQVVN